MITCVSERIRGKISFRRVEAVAEFKSGPHKPIRLTFVEECRQQMGESLRCAGNKSQRVILDDHTACGSPEEDADLQ